MHTKPVLNGTGLPPLGLLALALALAAGTMASPRAGAQASPSSPLVDAVLFCKWLPQFQFAGYVVAQELGFYSQAGLRVHLAFQTNHLSTTDIVSNVLASGTRLAFGIAASDIILEYNDHKPVVVLAALFDHSPLVLVARRDDGITNAVDLLHKRPIMLEPQNIEIVSYLADQGLRPNDLAIVPHTFSIAELLSGKVSAMSAYETDELLPILQSGIPLTLFRPIESGIDFYADVLFTRKSDLDENLGDVRAFLSASNRGWKYAFAHPSETIDLLQSTFGYDGNTSRHRLHFEAARMRQFIRDTNRPLASLDALRWDHIAGTYARQGLLPPGWSIDGLVYRAPLAPTANWIRASYIAGAMIVGSVVLVSAGVFLRRVATKALTGRDSRRGGD